MFSCSIAHSPTALVTLTKSCWLVPVNKETIGEIPPAFLIDVRLAGILAHSPKAPTTLIKT